VHFPILLLVPFPGLLLVHLHVPLRVLLLVPLLLLLVPLLVPLPVPIHVLLIVAMLRVLLCPLLLVLVVAVVCGFWPELGENLNAIFFFFVPSRPLSVLASSPSAADNDRSSGGAGSAPDVPKP